MDNGYQFLHIECYSKVLSKLAGKKVGKKSKKKTVVSDDGIGKGWTAAQILDEVMREKGAHPHVTHPKPPIVIHGNLDELADEIDKFEPPKGQRKDATILLGGVVSAPWPSDDPRCDDWQQDNLEWLKKEFGENLRAVVLHTDEPYDHLHFYVTAPELKPCKNLHPGWSKKNACKGSTTEKNAVYNDAMRAWQDAYFKEVSMDHGLARIGPGRRRLSRSEWQAEKAAYLAIAHAKKAAEEKVIESEKAIETVKVAQQDVQKSMLKVETEKVIIEFDRQMLDEDKKRLDREHEERQKKLALEAEKERQGINVEKAKVKVEKQEVAKERTALEAEKTAWKKFSERVGSAFGWAMDAITGKSRKFKLELEEIKKKADMDKRISVESAVEKIKSERDQLAYRLNTLQVEVDKKEKQERLEEKMALDAKNRAKLKIS